MMCVQKKRKYFLKVLLSLFLLLAPGLPIFCQAGNIENQLKIIEQLKSNLREQQEILTADREEFEQEKIEFEQRKNELSEKEKDLSERELDLAKEKSEFAEDKNLLQTMSDFYRNYRTSLKDEYWRGFKDGSLVSFFIGVAVGGYAGIQIGIKLPV